MHACRVVVGRVINLQSTSSTLCVVRRFAARSVNVSVSKDPTLADEAFQLQISGLEPNHEITLHSSLRLPNTAIFESLAHYIADEEGCISLDQHESHGGSFTGVEPMGPLSFMVPSPLNKRKYERFRIKDPTKPFTVDFRVLEGFIPSLEHCSAKNRFQNSPDLTVTRSYMLPGVKEIPVWDGKVRATLYIPEGDGPFPGIITMSGGSPGAMKHKAALLASHGFAALALKYFGEDDLTDDFFNIELEYIEEATMFMINHEMVNGKHGVGIVANCHGGSIALCAASFFPKGIIRCVASTNGWSIPFATITYKGKPVVPEIPVCDRSKNDDGVAIWRFQYQIYNISLDSIKDSSLPFYDRHETSYLLIAAEDDGYFPCADLAPLTRTLLESVNHPDYEILYYEGAGHLIEHSFYPLSDIIRTFKEPHFCGGKQLEHSIAQNDSWPRILEFVCKKLDVANHDD